MAGNPMVVTHVQQVEAVGVPVENSMGRQRVEWPAHPRYVLLVVNQRSTPTGICLENVVGPVGRVREAVCAHVLTRSVVGQSQRVAHILEVRAKEQ